MSEPPGLNPEHDDWAQARAEMVRAQLSARGIRDPGVLAAMGRVPRERFVPEPYRFEAYADRALPLQHGQTISQPYMVAYMTEMLDVRPEMKVLEVGTGSGYQCAVLAAIGARVQTVERLPTLAADAERLLASLGVKGVTVHCGDGSLGLPAEAPFDRILVTAGAPQVPEALVRQLKLGGRLVLPVGEAGQQVVVCVERLAGRTVETPGLGCRFVKLVGQQGWPTDAASPPAADG